MDYRDFPIFMSKKTALAGLLYKNLSDDELLSRYRTESDKEWLGRLLERYTLLLFGVAMKYLQDRDAAEDAVQQVFLKAIVKLPQGEIQNFKGWLYVLMKNHCLQLLRDRSYDTGMEVLERMPAEEGNPEAQLAREYSLEQLNAAMGELSDDQRQALELFYYQKLSYQQIMDRKGYSFMQVKSFIQNGKRNLKQILTEKLRRGTP